MKNLNSLKEEWKRETPCCERCGHEFAAEDIRCAKTLDYRQKKCEERTSYLIVCQDCNYKMALYEHALNEEVSKIRMECMQQIASLTTEAIKKVYLAEGEAIRGYSEGVKGFAKRPSGDKLYCGVHRWETNKDMIFLDELAKLVGASYPPRCIPQEYAKELRKKD